MYALARIRGHVTHPSHTDGRSEALADVPTMLIMAVLPWSIEAKVELLSTSGSVCGR